MTKLSESQIDYILDFIKPNKGIPPKTAESIMKKQIKGLKTQLESISLEDHNDINLLKNQIRDNYFKSLITAGESVGMISAQSFGEENTQSTLNTFHTAGKGNKAVDVGVSKFEELLNVAKNPKGKSCYIYFQENNKSISELRKSIGDTIVELTIEKIATDITEVLNKEHEDWYDIFKQIYNDEFEKFDHCISIKFNKEILFEYSLSLEKIAKVIEENYEDLHCVFSPDSLCRIDVFVDTSDIKIDNDVLYINNKNKDFIYLQETVKPFLNNLQICGIEGVDEIYFFKDPKNPNEWMIQTDGCNFQMIMGHPLVDKTRTFSTDPTDMYESLGIECANKTLYHEFLTLMPKINKCHAKLLCDKMTHTGSITSISRYARRKDDSGPMSKASFEETLENFLIAAAHGIKDETNGISASIICGKRGKMGTGACSLHVDVPALLKMNSQKSKPKSVPEFYEEDTFDTNMENEIYSSLNDIYGDPFPAAQRSLSSRARSGRPPMSGTLSHESQDDSLTIKKKSKKSDRSNSKEKKLKRSKVYSSQSCV